MPAAEPPMHELPKPRLRGRLHQAAFFASIPAGPVLLWVAPSPAARWGALVYWLTLLAQFGASASYHRGSWGERAFGRMRALDHSAIFLLIAGTYTPMSLTILEGTSRVVVLAVVWAGAVAGIGTKLYRVDLHVLSGILYVGLGWVAVAVLPAMARGLPRPAFVLVLAGGILYTLGALVLARKRPDPFPATFGYHEVWHAATVIAAACLYTAILLTFLAG